MSEIEDAIAAMDDGQLQALKVAATEARGTSHWELLPGIEPVWVTDKPATLPEMSDFWNGVAIACGDEQRRRLAAQGDPAEREPEYPPDAE